MTRLPLNSESLAGNGRTTMRPTGVFALVAAMLLMSAVATAEPSSEANEAGAQAMRKLGTVPWYDAEKDSLRRIDPPEVEEIEEIKKWEPPEEEDTSTSDASSGPSVNVNPGGAFGTLSYGVITLLTLVVVAVIGWIVYLVLKGFGVIGTSAPTGPKADIRRLENLPVPIEPTDVDLLTQARLHYEAGRYGPATIYYFSHLLVELDRHEVIQLLKGKTNWEYIRESRHRPELNGVVKITMRTFEDYYFGDHEITREQFEKCWEQRDQFARGLTG